MVILIPFKQGFLPKQYFLQKNPRIPQPVRVEQLPGNESVGVCPVRTILAYRSRVSPHRSQTQSSLFIPHNLQKQGRVHAAAIGRYVVRTVLRAYDAEGLQHPKDVRAHDVRGVATSLRVLTGVSLDDVVAAGGWSQPNTFVNFYLKEFSEGQLASLATAPSFRAAGGHVLSSSRFLQKRKGTKGSKKPR